MRSRAHRAWLLVPCVSALAGCPSSPGLLDVLSLSPSPAQVPPRGALVLAASGGSGEGYRFSVAINLSGGRVDEITGAYIAGGRGNVTDVVHVEDSAHNLATAKIQVGPGVRIAPAGMAMAPSSPGASFAASGGSGTGYVWQLVQDESGSSIDPTLGASTLYHPGPTQGATDLLQATDSLGNFAIAWIDVTDVVVWPSSVTLAPGATKMFYANVHSEPILDVTWDVEEAPSGGTIAATTPAVFPSLANCTYVAPEASGTYHLRATSVVNPAKHGRAEVFVIELP